MKTVSCVLVGLLSVVASVHAAVPAPATPDASVATQLDAAGLKYEIDDDGDYQLLFGGEDGRSQAVWVRSVVETLGKMRIREVISVAGPLAGLDTPEGIARAAAQLQAAMHDASENKLGGWVLKGKDANVFYYVAQIPADTDGEDLRSVVESVARVADAFEARIEAADAKDTY
jgi:hypothetical protein